MHLRSFITAALLALAAAAVAYMLFEDALPPSHPASADPTLSAHRVDAYYFHGNARCATCRSLEEYGHEALRRSFGDALEEGRLVWRPTNIDLPENRHFVRDFQLQFRSLVLVEVRDGATARWKNLERLWELAGDRDACVSYVEEETRRFMESL